MITTKQRATLRGMANTMEPIFQIGKGGINDNLIQQIDDALEARELIKISVLRNSDESTRALCGQVTERTGADPVQCIGSKFVIYRKSKEKQKIFF